MAITPFSNIPGRGQDPATFAARADNFLGVQLPRFQSEANGLAAEVDGRATEAALSAAQATAASDMAGQAVAGLNNYRGEWASLSGALAVPASVRHRGRFWILTAALTNVALSEPGVDVTKWEPVRRGAIVTGASVAALAGDDIVSTASSAITAKSSAALVKSVAA